MNRKIKFEGAIGLAVTLTFILTLFFSQFVYSAKIGDVTTLWYNSPFHEATYVCGRYNTTYWYAQNSTNAEYEWLSTDDDLVLQNAIDKTNATGGGIVYVKSGLFVANVEVKKNVLLILEPGAAMSISVTVDPGGYCLKYSQGKAWFYEPLDMRGEELRYAAFHTGTSPPTNMSVGQAWYDTQNYLLKIYNGTDWEQVQGQQGAEGPAGPAGQVEGCDYKFMVFRNSTSTYLLNGDSGAIEDSNNNNETVMAWAFGNLTSGRTSAETVVLKGGFTIGNALGNSFACLEIPDYIHIILEGHITKSANIHLMANDDCNTGTMKDVTIEGGIWEGNSVDYDIFHFNISGDPGGPVHHNMIKRLSMWEGRYGIFINGSDAWNHRWVIEDIYSMSFGDASSSRRAIYIRFQADCIISRCLPLEKIELYRCTRFSLSDIFVNSRAIFRRLGSSTITGFHVDANSAYSAIYMMGCAYNDVSNCLLMINGNDDVHAAIRLNSTEGINSYGNAFASITGSPKGGVTAKWKHIIEEVDSSNDDNCYAAINGYWTGTSAVELATGSTSKADPDSIIGGIT